MQLGAVQIDGVRDGTSSFPADFFGRSEGDAHAAMLDEDGRLQLPIGGFVIYSGDKPDPVGSRVRAGGDTNQPATPLLLRRTYVEMQARLTRHA